MTGSAGPPLWYRLAVGLPYGRDRVLNYLLKKNKLDRIVSFPFYDRTVLVPLNELPHHLSRYQHIRISAFAKYPTAILAFLISSIAGRIWACSRRNLQCVRIEYRS